jgi:polyphenol oxidase
MDDGKSPMDASRREFIKTAGAALGAVGLGLGGLQQAAAQGMPNDCALPKPTKPPVPFKSDPSWPMRVRKSAFELSTQESDKLKAAYKALRALTQSQPNNPIGWMQQANVHCWYCGGGNNGQQGEEIHESWWFFPWHRCYLFFHERILGKLINDPTLALPYWDWNTVGRNVLAAPYVTPNSAANPLYDKLRGQTPTAKIPANYVGAQAMQTVMSAPTTTAFMGTPNTAQQPVGGSLENGPHGSVHVWTGTKPGVDMGVLATAARDPIFFSHHGNIDRLWDVWLASGGTHKNPTSADWLNHRWDFYDENGVWTSISVQDVIDHEQSLRYRYQPPTSPLRSPGPNAVTTQDVAVANDVRAQLQAAAVAPPTHALRIQGFSLPANASAVVNVFANLPGAGPDTGVNNTHFVGTFGVIARGAGHDHGRTKTVDVPIPATAAAQFAEDKVNITLVPVDGSAKPTDVKFEKATVVPIE